MMDLRIFTSYKAKVMFTCVRRLKSCNDHILPFRGVPNPFRLGGGGEDAICPNYTLPP